MMIRRENKMRKNKFVNKGVIAALILLLLACSDLAFGYAGIVKLNKTGVLNGVTEVRLVSGGRPNQTSVANLDTTSNYSIDTSSDPTYNTYNIYNTSSDPTYLLLLKGTANYAIIGASMGTTVPITTPVDSVTFYKTGQPTPPTIGTIVAGYETAKVPITYDPNYEYSGVSIQVANDSGFTSLLKDAGGNSTTSGGVMGQYLMGELIDGRVLQSGSTYYFGISGSVAGVAASTVASKSFTTKAGGAGGPVTKTWTLSFNVKGVNTISLPFASVTSTINSKPAGAIGTFTVGDLIAEINNQIKAGGGQVSVFGWYDAVNQKQVGFSSLTYDTNGAIVAASSAPVGGAVITAPLTVDTPYQVTVTKAGSFTLTGTK